MAFTIYQIIWEYKCSVCAWQGSSSSGCSQNQASFSIRMNSSMMAHAFTRAFALGRYQVMFGSEFRRIAIKRKWFPMTIAEMSTLSKPVFMFERFSVTSQIVCWTDRRIYAEQKIVVRGEVRARCIVEGLPFSPRGKLTPAQMFDALALHIESPPIPVDIALWIEGRERVAANQKH